MSRPSLLRFAIEVLVVVDWRWVVLPPLVLGLELGFAYYWLPDEVAQWKTLSEGLSLVVLWSAVVIALWRALRTRDRFWLWLAIMMAALLFREYHLIKASTSIVYGVLFVLGLVAWRASPSFERFFRNRRFVTALMLMTFSYLITQSLDIDTFKKGHWVFGITEEMMELTGHSLALIAVLVAGPVEPAKTDRV